MTAIKASDIPSILPRMAIAMAVSVSLLVATPASAVGDDPAPAPENLRLVINDQGFVDRLEWDPPSSGTAPLRYDVNYRHIGEDPIFDDVFMSTTTTFLEASRSFGRFVECGPTPPSSSGWDVYITYPTAAGASARSNEITMCYP